MYSQTWNGTDLLASGYAAGAYSIVELQVSKAALRLGTWLNRLVAGELEIDKHMVIQIDSARAVV